MLNRPRCQGTPSFTNLKKKKKDFQPRKAKPRIDFHISPHNRLLRHHVEIFSELKVRKTHHPLSQRESQAERDCPPHRLRSKNKLQNSRLDIQPSAFKHVLCGVSSKTTMRKDERSHPRGWLAIESLDHKPFTRCPKLPRVHYPVKQPNVRLLPLQGHVC